MKEFISGAIAAFSVVAVYNLAKHIVSKKKPNTMQPKASITLANLLDEPSCEKGTSKVGRAICSEYKMPTMLIQDHPFNRGYIEKRKALPFPSGFALISTEKRNIFFFKHEIQNVLDKIDDKVVILDIYDYYKPIIKALGVGYTDISEDDLKENIMENYIHSNYGGDGEYSVSTLTERITCFNAKRGDDIEAVLKYVFTKSLATARKENKCVWLYIPSFIVTEYYSKQLYDVLKYSRSGGVIITAAVNIAAFENEEILRIKDAYLAITDELEEYDKRFIGGICNFTINFDIIYQFDMGKYIEQDELQEVMKQK